MVLSQAHINLVPGEGKMGFPEETAVLTITGNQTIPSKNGFLTSWWASMGVTNLFMLGLEAYSTGGNSCFVLYTRSKVMAVDVINLRGSWWVLLLFCTMDKSNCLLNSYV